MTSVLNMFQVDVMENMSPPGGPVWFGDGSGDPTFSQTKKSEVAI